MKTIKIGIIGAGRIGKVHAENIAKFVPEMEIKGNTAQKRCGIKASVVKYRHG